MELAQIVERGALELGVEMPPATGALFETYYAFLEQKRKNVNLTAIVGAEDTARLHFLDSLALLRVADFNNAHIVDIGSGAGFPGVPLKLAVPSISLTLLDATNKRVAFLTELCTELGIDAACIHARAEESARSTEMRGRFDIAASRAVARLNVLCELCLPFLRKGGVFLAMKGTDSDEELKEAYSAIHILGAEPEDISDYAIPGTEIIHRVITIRKTSTTPEAYPRRFSKIQKAPL